MNGVIAFLGKCNKYLCAAFLAAMVLVVFVNTVLRYLFHSGIIMGEELVRFMAVWAIFLGVISLYYDKRHIAVTTITDRLSKRTAAIFAFIANFGALIALAILLQGSVMYFFETTNMGQATGLPYKVIVVPVVVASASCLCLALADGYSQFRRILSGAE